MLDDAAYQEFWTIFDQTKSVRPEYLLPVLQIESGLDPSVQNRQGYDYWGLNQIAGTELARRGIDRHDYVTWPASRQLREIVLPYLLGQEKAFGPLRSGTRVYQANFYPKSLKTAKDMASVILTAPPRPCVPHDTNAYCANKGLDVGQKGTITVGDIGTFIGHAMGYKPVQDALARIYALRPTEERHDPVTGEDYDKKGALLPSGTPNLGLVLLGAGVLLAGGIGIALAIRSGEKGGAMATYEENPARQSMRVQTLLFDRKHWTPGEAKRWAKRHGYRAGKVHSTENYVRLRQEEPLRGGTTRMVTFGDGIKAVVQRP
jgi:hypothetical protein